MADIDMIPRSYRDGIRVRRALRRTAAVLAIVVLAAAAGSGALRWQTAGFARQAAALQAAATQAQSDQARDATLRAALTQRMQQEALLRALRRQGELATFAQAVDDSLPSDAWLTAITLRRDFQAPDTPVAIGSGQIQPAPAAAPEAMPTAGTIVELSGGAMNYESITAFLAQLGRAPGVAAVQLQSSGAGTEESALLFQAVVTLAWKDRP